MMKNEKTPSDSSKENIDKKTNAGIDHLVQSKVSNSGNSTVNIDITVEVDVKPIAFAIIYSLYVTNQLTEQELDKALKRLEAFTSNLESSPVENGLSPKGEADE